MIYSIFKQQKGKYKIKRFLKIWLPFGIVVMLIALPQLVFIHMGSIANGFSSSVLGLSFWNSQSIFNSIFLHVVFWFEVIGPLLLVGLIGLYFFRKRLIIFLPAFISLLIVNFVRFSPSFGDSNKIVLYFLLFMSISSMELFDFMWKKGFALRVIVIVVFIIIILGGILSEYYELFLGPYVIASNVEISASSWILNNTQKECHLIL